MTRTEIRIAAAKKRVLSARATQDRVYERMQAAVDATNKKHWPAIQKAREKARQARTELSIAELAAHGIVPMRTIFLWRGLRHVAQIDRDGWAEMVPVGAKNQVFKNRAPRLMPRRMDEVTILPDEVKE